VVSLNKPRATLGQKQFLINTKSQINKHQFSGKTTPPQYKDKRDATHPGGGLTPRMDWAAGLFPSLFPDVAGPTDADACQTEVSVDPTRRNDRTPRGRSSWRRRQRPRRRSLTLRLALQPLLDDSVDATPLQADGPGSAFVPRTVRHSLLLFPTTATSLSADVPWLPVSSGEPTQHSAFRWQQRTGTAVPSSQRRQHSRCEAPLRLTQSRRLRAITLSAHCRALSQLNFTSARLSTPLPHTAKYVCSLARSTLISRLSRNFLASPLKHVLFT